MPNILLPTLIVLHAVSSLLMAWPYYGTIITGERVKLGPPRDRADTYMENIIRQQSFRCMIFQVMMFITGALIIYIKMDGALIETLLTNLRLMGKVILVFLLVIMNIFMVFYLQPRIDKLIEANALNESETKRLGFLRTLRRMMAAMCLWYVLMAVILGVQAWTSFGLAFIIGSAIVSALFVLNTYFRLSPFGFI